MTMQILTIGVGASFAFAALVALYRVIVGPTILDRMIASDVFVTTLMLIVGAEMILNRHTNTIVLMIIFASTSVFATIMVAKHVRRREDFPMKQEEEEPRV